jgi:hypothetical protein
MSAIANAENNHGLDVDDLVVSEAFVGKNLVMKRFHARGRGRSGGIMKPFSQLTVIVREAAAKAAPESTVEESRRWVTRSIPSAFASASTAPGTPLVRQPREYGKLLHEDRKIREHMMKMQRRPASRRS